MRSSPSSSWCLILILGELTQDVFSKLLDNSDYWV
jgi:hypothetical protein